MAVEIFKQALREGKARVSRMQLTVIGDVGAGKTSLVRSLSGEEFVEERKETHGIDTSMVEMTELDESWHAVDLNNSYVDDILADKVCQGIKYSPGISNPSGEASMQGKLLSCSDPEPSFSDERQRAACVTRLPSIEGPSTSEGTSTSNGHQTGMIPVSSSSRNSLALGEALPRDIPVDQIVRRLSETSLSEKEKKYTKISIWDFAGHPLYGAMHHVFLNRRSFYLAVLNLVRLCNPESTNQALAEIHFWLNSIRVHTPHTTPVFLVGTRRNEVSEEDLAIAEKKLYDELIEKFGQQLVKSEENSFLFPVENTLGGDDHGAVALKKAIEIEASRLMQMDEELPVLWLHFEEEILKCREKADYTPCVSKAFLKGMMEQNTSRVVDEEEFESMLQFYHDSGVIILPGQ